MDKGTFGSYKFKPSDVIEGLNRYFAETKAHRYLRVPLEIKNGEVKPGNYYVFRNIVFGAVPRVKESGYYYLICDPEEVVGMAINWLREEHDIFYAPPKADGFEAKIEPLSSTFYCCDSKLVTETQRLQEENKKLKDRVAKQQKKIDSYEATLSKITDIMEPKYAGPTWSETWDDLVERIERMKETRTSEPVVPVAKVRETLGIAEDSDIFECFKYRTHQLETLRTELVEARRMYHKAIEERNQFGRRLMDIRKAAGMADGDPTDLVKYIEGLRKCEEEYEYLYKGYEKMYCELRDAKFTKLSEEKDRYKWLYENLKNGVESLLQEAEERED